jgi:hypothetical protein
MQESLYALHECHDNFIQRNKIYLKYNNINTRDKPT